MRVVTALLSLALVPLAARAAFHSNDTACTRHYTVVDGDTCDKIGQKTLTSTYQILAFNLLDAGSACYTLEIGQRLCLGRYGNDCQFVHECTNEDTCESIANNYGISTQTLKDNNPSLDCDIVYDGLMLCVSAGIIRPPADKSINATDVMIAREQARQAWIVQEKAKRPKSQHGHTSKHASHKKQQHKHHNKNTASLATSQTNDKSTNAQPSKSHQDVAKPVVVQDDAVKPDANLPSPVAERPATTQQQPPLEHSNSPPAQPASFQQQQQQESPSHLDEPQMLDELLSTASGGSNHTPHHTDAATASLADATAQHQRRHRSLSSRSHHQQQRSHTHS